MLFIKFKIQDLLKYVDFQKLYKHMVDTRQPGFEFEEKKPPDFNNMTMEEMDEALEMIIESGDKENQEYDRYKMLIPDYADCFFESYIEFDNERAGTFGFEKINILNYLEFSFEVDLDNLEKLNENNGIVEFSTGNYPFGGIERFLMTLKAFELQPIECFNGFSIIEIDWITNFKYNTIELAEKTKVYLKNKS